MAHSVMIAGEGVGGGAETWAGGGRFGDGAQTVQCEVAWCGDKLRASVEMGTRLGLQVLVTSHSSSLRCDRDRCRPGSVQHHYSWTSIDGYSGQCDVLLSILLYEADFCGLWSTLFVRYCHVLHVHPSSAMKCIADWLHISPSTLAVRIHTSMSS